MFHEMLIAITLFGIIVVVALASTYPIPNTCKHSALLRGAEDATVCLDAVEKRP